MEIKDKTIQYSPPPPSFLPTHPPTSALVPAELGWCRSRKPRHLPCSRPPLSVLHTLPLLLPRLCLFNMKSKKRKRSPWHQAKVQVGKWPVGWQTSSNGSYRQVWDTRCLLPNQLLNWPLHLASSVSWPWADLDEKGAGSSVINK